MKKNIFIVLILCLIVLVFIFLMIFHLIKKSNLKINDSYKLTEKQVSQIKQFFFDNKNEIKKIKDSLVEQSYNIESINNDGYIILHDNTKIWLNGISESILLLMSKAIDSNIESINYGEVEVDKRIFWFEAYFPENAMCIEILYLPYGDKYIKDRSMYECIEDNWYLFVAGMT